MYISFQIFTFHVATFSFCLTVGNNVIHVNGAEENENSRQQIPNLQQKTPSQHEIGLSFE
jgi:hypothetical protein